MPIKLHPSVEVHGDAKTELALSGTIQKSGSITSMNPRGTSTPAPAQAQNGQGRWRPGHGKV
jgi:hypothetical protein